MKIDLGDIKIGKEIGKGGYGIVYEAELPQLGNYPVAVKVFDPTPFQGEAAINRFVQEAKILLSLRHPNIISVYNCGIYNGKPYILMEKFGGWDLAHVRKVRGAPAPGIILPFFRKVSAAMAHAHSRGILHRDLKPENLMTTEGDARVIDFGIARIIDPQGVRFTRTGGTPMGGGFAAPEYETDPRSEDPRCDIFSLGACWYWLLTGRTPSGRNWELALSKVDGVTSEYEAVVFKCLNQLDSRFGSMTELEVEIRALELGEKTESATELLIDDDTMLVMGSIFEQEGPGDNDGVSIYEVERQMIDHISKLKLRIILNRLKTHNFIRVDEVKEWNDSYEGYFVTEEGESWVSKHHDQIELLLKTIEPKPEVPVSPPTDEDDGLPF